MWGSPAEAAFQAVASIPGTGATTYVQIGSAAGGQAAMPASLLRSRPFRVSRSDIGSFDMRRYFAQVPVHLRLIAVGKVHLDAHVYPLSHVSEAWAAPVGRRPVLTAG